MSRNTQLVLLGAGAAGGYALRHLRAQGIEPVVVADNNSAKWGTSSPRGTCVDGIAGVEIVAPSVAKDLYPDAEWVACAISRPAATELRLQLDAMGVRTKPLWKVLPVCHGLPPADAEETIQGLLVDVESLAEWKDQLNFRTVPDYDRQRLPSGIKDIYFPGFIQHRDDEHFVDAGAADGDTVKAFTERWKFFEQISAFEPDRSNMDKLREATHQDSRVLRFDKALSDHRHNASFTSNGDYSSHLGGITQQVQCWALDDLWGKPGSLKPPTYIKMDIEGSELEALWGVRRILKEHSPVLAICAYHTSDHLWQIPLLIHAIQPDYKLFFRRYAEGAFEIVWYAVPPERVVSDQHRAMAAVAGSDHDCPGVHS